MTATRLPPNRWRLAVAVRDSLADLPPQAPVLVACSGGPDSLALAGAMGDLGHPARAAVVDHGLQGNSAAMAAAAADQCRELGLSARVLPVAVDATGRGPEAAARTARYAALSAAAADAGAAAVLLGHTADDQAETVLLGLLRGSGTRSLAGMAPLRGGYRRPFLDVPRAVIEAALAEHAIHPWRDPHNTDPRYVRSRLRHTVMPMLTEQLGPGVGPGLLRTARLARADADLLDEMASEQERRLAAADWPTAELAKLAAAVRWRVLRRLVLAAGCPATDVTLDHVLEVDRLVTRWRGQGPLHLPGRVRVSRTCGRLVAQTAPAAGED